jgi:MFS family permease
MLPAQSPSDADQLAWGPLFPAVFIMAWGGNHFSPLLSMYRQRADFSAVQVDLFFAAYILGLVPGFLLSGSLSDRHGRKPLMVCGLALGAIGSAIPATGGYSATAVFMGRIVCGLSVAISVVVGSSWIKELSSTSNHRSAGARRSSLSLTGGFAIGAFVSGALAQFGPAQMVVPYLLHIGLSALCIPFLLRSPRSRGNPDAVVSPLRKLNLTDVNRRRYWTIVVPAAVVSSPGPPSVSLLRRPWSRRRRPIT